VTYFLIIHTAISKYNMSMKFIIINGRSAHCKGTSSRF